MNEAKLITLTIDDREVRVPAGTSIMEAAETIGVHVPRLCYHPDLSLAGACRVCIVAVKGTEAFAASCSTPVMPGMVVQTASPDIRQARRDIVELILDNHPKECQTCERDSNCELQNLAYAMGVRERFWEGRRKHIPLEASSRAVIRNGEKCILCGRCTRVCAEVQGVYNLSQHYRGFNTLVAPAHLAHMDDSVCIQCGQCINVCPTAAFLERSNTDAVWAALANPQKHVVVQTAPSIRAAIGEGFGLAPGTPATGKMISALRTLGFDKVFDTDLGADLTIFEEASEFLRRLGGEGPLPMITSCSPGWISFMEKFYPSLIPNASTCKSPMSMMSTMVKTFYAEQAGIDPDDIFSVAVMPCVAKKYEIARPEHRMPNGKPYTDAVITTRELIWMIECYGMSFTRFDDGEFDAPLGIATGAGDIFGSTGGVMEATLRTASEFVTGKPGDRLEFAEVRAVEGVREALIELGGKVLRIGVANGLTNAKHLLDMVVSGEKEFHVIEVMACPGGCIGGGGQPYPPKGVKVLDPELLRKRAAALYAIDGAKTLRRSHQNPAIKELYEKFLGKPGAGKAHELLHTQYSAKEPRGIR
ncbi:MAG TPA: NADH-dependent [FeFe] hydrogenase, group A6 [Candidatus Bathyarchaeia archaeon]|nr:NADH-dependent [FeFe] hydrogenase, group A6 [Candidatus Bathyarchaeia archaeon]